MSDRPGDRASSTRRGVAFLFPGQGAQHVGMGRELAESAASTMELYEESEEILGVPLRRICWELPPEELTRTENAQPAILLHSYAVWRRLPVPIRRGARAAAGHSLGEFTAHLAAGVLSFPDALRLVRRRGELMARSRGGTMAAVLGLEDEEVERICEAVDEGVVVAANYNAPGQVVVSGEPGAVERAGSLAEEAGARRVIPLDVGGAFHSPLMEVAREGLEEVLETVDLSDPEFPVMANASGKAVTSAEEARRLLVRQLTSPVRWTACVRRVQEEEPARWLELGSGKVLTGLARRIDRGIRVTPVGGPEELGELGELEPRPSAAAGTGGGDE